MEAAWRGIKAWINANKGVAKKANYGGNAILFQAYQ